MEVNRESIQSGDGNGRSNPRPEGNAQDIFQELRRKKLQEPSVAPATTTVSEVFSETAPHPHRTSRFRLILAAGLGALACLACVKFFLRPTPQEAGHSLHGRVFAGSHGADTLEALGTKHAAVKWDQAIPTVRRANPFSVEIADAFLRDEPVLARVVLLDVERGRGGLAVRFGIAAPRSETTHVLWLECYRDQLPLFAAATKGKTEFAIVAQCYEAQHRDSGYFITGRLVDAQELSASGRATPNHNPVPSLMEAANGRTKNSGN